MHRKRAQNILEDLKKSQLSWDFGSEEDGWLSGPHVLWGADGKASIKKIVPLSLCRKTFKLKGNKKFRTWTKKS